MGRFSIMVIALFSVITVNALANILPLKYQIDFPFYLHQLGMYSRYGLSYTYC
jgi:hypothetical protein